VYFRKKAETFGILPTIGMSGRNQKIKMTQITSRNILPKKIKTLFYLLNKRHYSTHQYKFQSSSAETKKAP
jgi:hypothetical protein